MGNESGTATPIPYSLFALFRALKPPPMEFHNSGLVVAGVHRYPQGGTYRRRVSESRCYCLLPLPSPNGAR